MNVFGFEYLKSNTHYCIICSESIVTNSADICRVCGWEDDDSILYGDDDISSPNLITTNMYRERFEALRKVDKKWAEFRNGAFQITEEEIKKAQEIYDANEFEARL